MSPVIKSADASSARRVRPLNFNPKTPDSRAEPVDVEKVQLRADLEQAISLIQSRDVEIERLTEEIDRAAREAEAKGHENGLKAAADRQAERLTLLKASVAQAVNLLKDELAGLERLAPLVAAEALERLVGDGGARADLLRDIVVRTVAHLDADTIVRVEVASTDFPDTTALAADATLGAQRRIEVRHASDLKSGDCRVRLVLGELEVGINQQWGRLSDLLRDLALPEPAQ